MSYSARMQKNHLYSILLAPRGRVRMADAGAQIAQMYLSPFDQLIGVIGDSGSGKSVLIKGMFPGLELTNDDEGVNVRPLPIMDTEDQGFFRPHTYHLDIRFELGFYQLHELAFAINSALERGKRVVVEHFDLIHKALGKNADLLIGVGEELVVTRPSFFGPEPQDVYNVVYKSINYRRMAHSAEDLVEYCLSKHDMVKYSHGDVRHGFILSFRDDPKLDLAKLEREVQDLIDQDIPISFLDDNHVLLGDTQHYCTAPRMHVERTSDIKNFRIYPQLLRDNITDQYMLVGIVGFSPEVELVDINSI